MARPKLHPDQRRRMIGALRVNLEEGDLIREALRLSGESLAPLIRRACLEEARRMIDRLRNPERTTER